MKDAAPEPAQLDRIPLRVPATVAIYTLLAGAAILLQILFPVSWLPSVNPGSWFPAFRKSQGDPDAAILAMVAATNRAVAALNQIDLKIPPSPEKKGIPAEGSGHPRSMDLPPALKAVQDLEDFPVPGTDRLAMDRFYESLQRTASGEPEGITRIIHLGDSLVAADFITATLRRRFQIRFGDCGHGFLFIRKPWLLHGQKDVKASSGGEWKVHRITGPLEEDGCLGLGGVSFRADSAGSWAEFSTDPHGEVGKTASALELAYQEFPGGGDVEVRIDEEMAGRLFTGGDTSRAAFKRYTVPDGPHSFRIESIGNGPIRLFDVTLERKGPGVVYSSIAIQGGKTRSFLNIEREHWLQQLRHRGFNLVVLLLGGNDSANPKLNILEYKAGLEELIHRIQEALPESSILLLSPPDRCQKRGGEFVTRPLIPTVVEVQREIARKTGCAFWNTFQVMGGRESMGRWRNSKLKLASADLTHFTERGAEVVGNMIYSAILKGFLRWKSRQ